MELRIQIATLLLLLFWPSSLFFTVESKCSGSCNLALASYFLDNGTTLSNINLNLNSPEAPYDQINFEPILRYNPSITNKDLIQMGTRLLVPFPCECQPGDFLAHVFRYSVQPEDTYDIVATEHYANLTTEESLRRTNSFPATNIPPSATLNVSVNCFCGNESVSKDYGLFVTYPLRPEDSLDAIASSSGVPAETLQRYNPGVDFRSGSGIVFVPGKDPNGTFPPFKSSDKGGLGAGVIAGICIGVLVALLLISFVIYYVYRKNKKQESHSSSIPLSAKVDQASLQSGDLVGTGVAPGLAAISVDKSVEFTLEELAKATDNFNLSFKIGQGGFGAVYYAELRGEKAAIKKMDMEASKQFLAELKVLTRVHHVNLVRLIGYCVEGSLFLIYEYVENGNLGQHLHGSGREPLPWTKRVHIALDSARGLEYIHEHTVPVYVHRDIKSANILIDQNFRAKVADFGLTKLTEVGSSATRGAMGTFGYMAPEIVYGEVSAKVDVYAFGVVLYELISAKAAVVKMNQASGEFRGLVGVFEEVFKEADKEEALRKIIDPRLGDNYPFDSVYKMAELGKACTQENAQLRPSMRYIVVALSTLFSSTGNWDVGNFQNDDIVSLMSGISKSGVPFRSMVVTGGFKQRTQLENLEQGVDVLIATPGRFTYLMNEGILGLSNLRCAILDEVDILFGDEEFESALQNLISSSPVTAQYLFVTATLPLEIYNKLVEVFPDCEVVMGPRVHRVSNALEEVLVDCSGDDNAEKTPETAFQNKKAALLQIIEENPVAKTIIFCNKIETCRKVENIFKRLDRNERQLHVLPFHAALAQGARLANMEEFTSSHPENHSLFLVCTDRASRGIDFSGVDHVVLFDFPRDPSEYVRRVGRTARGARGEGKAFVFVVGKQVTLARRIIERNQKGHPVHDVPNAYEFTT